MAKQTFTTGQVLTAAQVTALQTNQYNQTVTTQTTSYVLVAADVGTRVYMNAAGATTITVNTGVFAAGDTVWLGNIGAGSCVVTAGTATVSKFSTASLTLSQYQGAYLYFVSTGVAILYSDSAGASIPLTTKGDLFGYDTANARVPIGTNNQVLTADSAQALGLKWATPAAADKTFSLVSSTAFSGSTFTVSGLSGDNLFFQIVGVTNSSASQAFRMRFNTDSSSKYGNASFGYESASAYSTNNAQTISNAPDSFASIQLGWFSTNTASAYSGTVLVCGANTAGLKPVQIGGGFGAGGGNSHSSYIGGGIYSGTSAISSVSFVVASGSYTAGTLYVYKG